MPGQLLDSVVLLRKGVNGDTAEDAAVLLEEGKSIQLKRLAWDFHERDVNAVDALDCEILVDFFNFHARFLIYNIS